MRLENYDMNLPSYSIGDNIYEKIAEKCEKYGTKIFVIGGKKALEAALKKIETAVRKTRLIIIGTSLYGDDCTYKNVEKLRNMSEYRQADMVFAVGGGKAIDTCKCLCIDDNKPVFTFPTIASNCAACTAVSIMYNDDGTFLKPHFFNHPPVHTFIDTDIISHAPAKYMWAGIGDTYAKYYEAKISSRNERTEHFTSLGVALSNMCLEPLMIYGKKAYEDNKNCINSYDLEQAVLAIVVTTGIVSIFLTRDFTPDYNSGMAHAVFYALTKFPVIEKKHLHGEVVGFGVLIALLYDGNKEEFKRIYDFNKSIRLPIKLSDIEITREQFEEVIKLIPDMSDVAHYPYKIEENKLRETIDYLENLK